LPLLNDDAIAIYCREQLLRWAVLLKIEIVAYIAMPDHAHILVFDRGKKTSTLLHRWKQATGYHWRSLENAHPLWQRGYHDRVLRLDENPDKIAEYILMNPVVAGLAERPEDYSALRKYPEERSQEKDGRSKDRPLQG
jgi:REP element-mobilizing transposase RayT